MLQKVSLDILDLGCGEGYYTKSLKEAFKKDNIYGLDISKEAINMATKYTKEVYWLVGNSKNLEFISLMLVYNLFFTVLLFSFVFVFIIPFTYFLAQLGNQIRMLICDIILFELILFHII